MLHSVNNSNDRVTSGGGNGNPIEMLKIKEDCEEIFFENNSVYEQHVEEPNDKDN